MTAFPDNFVWGVATSSYQIEGAVHEDGRGESVWDRFCRTPGKVRAGDTGDVACDFYHRYPEDIRLMQELGIDAFRFSVAWPRVVPEGRGRVNAAGLDFYDRLVDALLAAGITPFLNLYHWDLPQPLDDAGGWPARATAEAFADYADVVAARLGDRVRNWITHNEPFCSSWLGHGLGVHAPGRRSVREALAAAHHILLSHGLAVDVLREALPPEAEIGIVIDSWPVRPATQHERDVRAARHADGMSNRWFFDALFRGAYPEDMLEAFGDDLPAIADGDLRTIATPIDFVGVNNYSRRTVRADTDGRPVDVPPVPPLTDMGWEIDPTALAEVLTRLHRAYGVDSLYVTENGAAFSDVRTHDGRIHDVERIDYLRRHVDAVGGAIADGVPVRGYFAWSFLDNFEWAEGYARRFGLVYVDYPTLERVPKDSFDWFRQRIARSGDRATARAVGAAR